jgi:hypothetical protein
MQYAILGILLIILLIILVNLLLQISKLYGLSFFKCKHKKLILEESFFKETGITIYRCRCETCGLIGRCSDVPSLAYKNFKTGFSYTNTFINVFWKPVKKNKK